MKFALIITTLAVLFMLAHLQAAGAQSDCSGARRLYDQAHEATAARPPRYEAALQLLEQIKTSMPRICRLETDEKLAVYEANLRTLLAKQQAGGPPTPCQPLQTGPTSYSC